MVVCSEIRTPVAVVDPVLIIVTKAVALCPTWTDRLAGKTADTNDWAQVEGANDTNIPSIHQVQLSGERSCIAELLVARSFLSALVLTPGEG